MKKLLLGAVALAMLASCTNDEEGALRPKSDQIGFSGVFSNTLTRAANGFNNNEKPQTFGAAMYYEEVAGSNTFTKHFDKTSFTTTDFNLWEPASIISWPVARNSENVVKVFAYTIPSYGFNSAFWYSTNNKDNQYYQTSYSVPTNVAEQEDVCLAAYVGTRG
ncbi:MAG: fimbrillin family protein, partial [Muribaculaceae bacterium]|nr:fimbrillin family protein [Bacteroidales bacterium]MDY2734078.1 fimbrillin family protein [Muribaculaceae bacterium]